MLFGHYKCYMDNNGDIGSFVSPHLQCDRKYILYVYDSGVCADFTLRLTKPKCDSSSTFSHIQLSDYYDTEMCMKSKIIN